MVHEFSEHSLVTYAVSVCILDIITHFVSDPDYKHMYNPHTRNSQNTHEY